MKTQPEKGDLVETYEGELGEVYSVRQSKRFGWLVRLLGKNIWQPLDHIVVPKEERSGKAK